MSVKREPQKLKVADENVRDAWFYETPKRIEIVVEVLMGGGLLRTVFVNVPRHKLADWIVRTAKPAKRTQT